MRIVLPFCLVAMFAGPAMGGTSTYLFEVSSGGFSIDVLPNNFVTPDPAYVPVAGTFSMTITDNDGVLGPGDTFTLGGANIYNSQAQVEYFVSMPGTATFPAGGTRITGFSCPTPGQIAAGPVGTIDPNVYVRSILDVAGATGFFAWMNGHWDYQTSRVDVQTFNIAFEMADGVPVGVTLDGTFTYTYELWGAGASQFGQSVQIQGVLVPDPACLGFVALLLGAGVRRLRQR